MPIRKREYKSGKKVWEVYWRDSQGKRHNKVCPTHAAARHYEAKVLKEKFEEKELGLRKNKDIEWDEITKAFLENSKNTWTNNTFKLHKLCLKNWTEFLEKKFNRGKIYLGDVTLEVINEFKSERSKTVKNSTINRELTCLKTLLNWTIDFDEYNYMSKLPRKIKMLKEAPGRLRYLSENEMKSLIENAIPLHLKIFYIIAFATGMRKGEILGLKWQNIDLGNGLIYVHRTKEKDTTKSGKSRGVNIDSGICDILKWWKEQIGKEYELKKYIKHYKCPVDKENIFTIKDIKRAHKTACKNAGIKDFRIHDCRHTAATFLRHKGTRLDTLMDILGHSTIKLTMRYAHIGSEEKKKAAESIGVVLVSDNLNNTLKADIKPTKK